MHSGKGFHQSLRLKRGVRYEAKSINNGVLVLNKKFDCWMGCRNQMPPSCELAFVTVEQHIVSNVVTVA